jgi:shikimate dehydrogenase
MMEKKFVLAGVMGWPVEQSRSPVIHNYWIKKHQLNGVYGKFAVKPGSVKDAIRGMPALGIAGSNVTAPHKVEAMQLMDYLDPIAKKMGAINCIVVQPDGSLHGFNNDGFGYIQSLRDVKPNWRADEGPITIIGSGGVSRALLVSLIEEGATEIRLFNRSRDKADALADEFGGPIKVYNWDERHDAVSDVALLVNATNQGMYNQPELDLRLDQLPKTALVSDTIYIPLETPFLKQARERGNLTVNGLGMLLNQAIPAFKAWFGVTPEITDELRAEIAKTF